MTEIVETPVTVREAVRRRYERVVMDIASIEEVVANLTAQMREQREVLVRKQIEAEDMAIWLERNDA